MWTFYYTIKWFDRVISGFIPGGQSLQRTSPKEYVPSGQGLHIS